MPPTTAKVPGVQPLPRARRRFVFLTLFTFFVLAVPVFVFYATGYRYNFMEDGSITATGGLYVTVGTEEGEVYLNESPVRDLRVFRSAIYIQNLLPGMQRLHVQTPGYRTWVKELPIYPHIVTEAEAFGLPNVPQIRPISNYQTSTGTQVFLGTTATATAALFTGVSTSVPVMGVVSKATSTLVRNTEYDFIVGLFATSTVASSTLLTRVASEVTSVFQGPVASTTLAEATTTKLQGDLSLGQAGDDIVVNYLGSPRSIPYYFCVPKASLASTSDMYGPQVMRGVASVLAATPDVSETSNLERICRNSIIIDRQYQEVQSFDFFPGSTDLIVMHRADGIFVTEVDDRSWQNTQALYPYAVDEMVIDNGRIYVKKAGMILELLPELITAS